jgi:phosphoribosylanthranilate isomerase
LRLFDWRNFDEIGRCGKRVKKFTGIKWIAKDKKIFIILSVYPIDNYFMTKVKICGITNLEDALLSAKFGADALGFNFYSKSQRYISPEKAREIIEQLPKEVLKVGVFVNESLEKISEIASTAKLDAIQLHGEETPEFALKLKAKMNLEIIKAFRVSREFKPEEVLQYEADAVLLDAYSANEHGGTGETFDWEIAKNVREIFPKMYLAGGISADNVGNAIRQKKPYAVDACSKLESEKGKKDKIKIVNFIRRAKNTDRTLEQSKNIGQQKLRPVIKNVPKGYFFDMMSDIHALPEIYIGKKSLSILMMYLHGYHHATQYFGVEFENGFFPESSSWMINKLSVENKPSLHFSELILEECKGDEEAAFNLYFALLEEFKLEKEDLSNE